MANHATSYTVLATTQTRTPIAPCNVELSKLHRRHKAIPRLEAIGQFWRSLSMS
ncbi:MAG: hypothetical protein WBA43_22095 [Elainellaceae cyanobacterium]